MNPANVETAVTSDNWENLVTRSLQALSSRSDDDLAIEVLQVFMENLYSVPNSGSHLHLVERASKVLERIYRSTDQWQKLADIMEKKLAICDSDEERLNIHLKLRELYEMRLDDATRAFSVMARAFNEQPQHEGLRQQLERLAEKQGRTEMVLGAYLDAVDRIDDAELAGELRKRVAWLCENRMEDHQEAVSHLEHLMESSGPESEVLSALERLHGQQGDYSKVVSTLETRLVKEQRPDTRLKILRELVRLYDQELDQKPMAFLAACRAFREGAEDEDTLASLESLADQTDSLEELAILYQEALEENETSKAASLAIMRALARLEGNQLEERESAAGHWQELIRNIPDDLEAHRALEQLYREQNMQAELSDVLRRLIRLEPKSEQRKDLSYEMASVLEEQGRGYEAMEAYLKILQDNPSDATAIKLLNNLLKAEAKRTTGGSGLRDSGRVLDICRRILERKSGHPDALQCVEMLLVDEGCRQEAAKILEPVYRAGAEWKKLADVLEIRLSECPDSDVRVMMFSMLRELYESRLDEPYLAFGVASRVFNEWPEDVGLRMNLERLAAEEGRLDELVGIYLDTVERLTDDKLVAQLRRRVAWICEHRLADQEEAIHQLQLALKATGWNPEVMAELKRLNQQKNSLMKNAGSDPAQDGAAVYLEQKLEQLLHNDEMKLEAARRLEPIYRKRGDFSKLVAVLKVTRAHEPDAQKRLQIAKELIRISAEELDHKPFAFLVAYQAFQENPEDNTLRNQLERLAQQTDSMEELVLLYEEVLETSGHTKAGPPIMKRLAKLYCETGEPGQAVVMWHDVLARRPQDQDALTSLEELYRDQADYRNLIGILHRQAKAERNLDRKKDLFYELASIAEEKLKSRQDAIDAYLDLLAADPTDPVAAKLLNRCYISTPTARNLAATPA